MNKNDNILGCFVSSSIIYNATDEEKKLSDKQSGVFRSYIWNENGIANAIKKLKHDDYGKDLVMVLFQFYINPIPYLRQNLKEIERYRKNEKSVGIPVIITNENFFNRSENDRLQFLKESILGKLDVLSVLIRKKKLDTNIELLSTDLRKALNTIEI